MNSVGWMSQPCSVDLEDRKASAVFQGRQQESELCWGLEDQSVCEEGHRGVTV